jgi:hypothetical protein
MTNLVRAIFPYRLLYNQVSCCFFTQCSENGNDGGGAFQFCQQRHHGTNEQALLWQMDEINLH